MLSKKSLKTGRHWYYVKILLNIIKVMILVPLYYTIGFVVDMYVLPKGE